VRRVAPAPRGLDAAGALLVVAVVVAFEEEHIDGVYRHPAGR